MQSKSIRRAYRHAASLTRTTFASLWGTYYTDLIGMRSGTPLERMPSRLSTALSSCRSLHKQHDTQAGARRWRVRQRRSTNTSGVSMAHDAAVARAPVTHHHTLTSETPSALSPRRP
jgi:hypothetical protein